ncbi:phospholipase C/P1 nuclease domain-containing protein, partial [Gorgonomyces haynaldii]
MIALFTTPLGVHAWGPEGHSMIGDMAQTYLKPKALAAVQTLLNGTSLGDNANWADTVKRSDPWKWSSNLHFIDIIDRPPEECIFNEDRDCPKGDCINTAIGNFTNRACSANVDDAAVAVKFLTHFLGDITQPLHNSNYTLGGNQINVTFNGTNYNLHKIWDIDMPAARMNQFGGRAGYQKYLLDRINTGDFAALKKDWISKQPYNAVSKYGNSLASIDYTIDAATFDCSYVYKTFTTTPPYDLSGDYTTQSFPILDLQFAKAAVRLADLLNSIFDNCGSAPST